MGGAGPVGAGLRGRADLPPLTYLSFDSIVEGVGVSQVLPYVERLGRQGLNVTLHTFERASPHPSLVRQLADAGVHWRAHRFGASGARGGMARVVRGAAAVRGAELVHARADLPAASVMVARCPRWIWDVRSFWREQRLDQGTLREGAPEERLLRSVESRAARESAGIIALSHRAIEVLSDRHGNAVRAKSQVVTTCADLERFTPAQLPSRRPTRFVLSGSLNRLYDVPTMIRLVERMQARSPAELTVLTPSGGPWEAELRQAGARIGHVPPDQVPEQLRSHHIGLSILTPHLSNCAATPTKIGEYLACGRPVVVNSRLGDMDAMVAEYRCGVVVTDCSKDGLDDAAHQLDELLKDPETPRRCRALAEKHFNIDRGVEQLIDAYVHALR